MKKAVATNAYSMCSRAYACWAMPQLSHKNTASTPVIYAVAELRAAGAAHAPPHMTHAIGRYTRARWPAVCRH
jgi:hypothetical protein